MANNDEAMTTFDRLSRAERRKFTAATLSRAESARDDEERLELLDDVVLANMCVARSIASRYRSRGVSREDLEQVANAALVRAVHQYDGRLASDFLAYAVPSIRGELRRYFRDSGWMVRPPRKVQELQSQVVEEREKQRGDSATAPTHASVARALGVPEDDVAEALAAEGCFTPTSLDTSLGEGGSASLGDLLPDSDDRDREAAEARMVLRPVVRGLSRREQRLLKLRFFEQRTQQEIADEFGVTQTQVSRLLAGVLRDLRKSLVTAPPDEDQPPADA